MTVLFLEGAPEHGTLAQWTETLTTAGHTPHRGITFRTLQRDMAAIAAADPSVSVPLQSTPRVATSVALMQWLHVHGDQFGVVVLHDWLGAGYHAQVVSAACMSYRVMRWCLRRTPNGLGSTSRTCTLSWACTRPPYGPCLAAHHCRQHQVSL